MEALKSKPAPGGGAGDFTHLSNLPASYTENLGTWQSLGDVAVEVVASVALRRELFIARHCRVSAGMAHAIASVAFDEEAR